MGMRRASKNMNDTTIQLGWIYIGLLRAW